MFGHSRKERYRAALARVEQARARLLTVNRDLGGRVILTSVLRRSVMEVIPNHPIAVEARPWRKHLGELALKAYESLVGYSEMDRRKAAVRAGEAAHAALMRGEWSLEDYVTPVPITSPDVMLRLQGRASPVRPAWPRESFA
jgi:hypothetical protein